VPPESRMFLFHLNQAECLAFVGLAKYLIAADGREGPTEKEALRALGVELGMPIADLTATAPTAQVLGTFASRTSRAAAVLELLALAYADGVPHPEEMEMLKSVATGLGISELRLLEMEHWVVQQQPLTAEARRFLFDDEE
jgi:tellurite resistance protein